MRGECLAQAGSVDRQIGVPGAGNARNRTAKLLHPALRDSEKAVDQILQLWLPSRGDLHREGHRQTISQVWAGASPRALRSSLCSRVMEPVSGRYGYDANGPQISGPKKTSPKA
jgi:hypothetical protein